MGGAMSIKRHQKGIPLDHRVNFLKQTPFFLYLTEGKQLEEFAKCFSHCLRGGKTEGESVILRDDRIYIVVKGGLELCTAFPVQHAKVENQCYLCKKYPGDIISKLQTQKYAARMLSDKNKKLESFFEIQTRTCSPDALLMYSDEKCLDKFIQNYPELAKSINSITHSHIENYLANIPFLQNVKDSQLNVLAAMCKYEALSKDQIVFEENSPGSKLYIILSGSVSILAPQWVGNATVLQQSLEWGKCKKVSVGQLECGDYFGEISLFANINRTSTVIAKEKSLLLTVEKKTFENFLMVCPLKNSMTSVMKERMVTKLSSLNIPFLMGIPPGEIKAFTNLVEINQLVDGDVVFCEGDVGDRFYIIIHGEVKIESCGLLGPGNYFGEMALVSNNPRSATVIATCNTILLSVNKESFHRIFASNKQALAEFRLRLLRGSAELFHVLAHSIGISMYHSFLRRIHAEESLDFWLAVDNFCSIAFKNNDMMWQKGKSIFDQFCAESSEHQVNLPDCIRTVLQSSLEKKDTVQSKLFQEAKEEIYQLMVRDNYLKFKASPDCKELFERCLGVRLDQGIA